jgi:hypothetical protein
VRITIVGTIIFAVAMAAAVYLVSSLVLSEIFAILATIAVTALLGWSWFFVPLVTFARDKQ